MKNFFANKKVLIGVMSALIAAVVGTTVLAAPVTPDSGTAHYWYHPYVDANNLGDIIHGSGGWYYQNPATGYESNAKGVANPTDYIPAQNFHNNSDGPSVIRISGSSTVYPILASSACQTALLPYLNANVTVGKPAGGYTGFDVTYVNSGVGKDDMGLGITDIGMASSGIGTFTKPDGTGTDNMANYMTQTAIAVDAIVIIVHSGSPGDPDDITSLTQQQIYRIEDHTYTTWNQVGSSSTAPIVVRARSIGSGTRASLMDMTKSQGSDTAAGFDDTWMDSATPPIARMEGNPEMQTAISTTAHSMGYVGLGFDTAANIRDIPVKKTSTDPAYLPTPQLVYANSYSLSRKLYVLTPGPTTPAVGTLQATFISWMTDMEHEWTMGQNFVSAAEPVGGGFLKLKPAQDVDQNGSINGLDMADAGYHMDEGTATGGKTPRYSPVPGWERSDVNGDHIVSGLDFAEIGYWLGISY